MSKPAMTNMKAIRKRAGYTQQEVSQQLNIPLSTLRKWEQGLVARPDKYSLNRMAELYGVPVDDFSFDEDIEQLNEVESKKESRTDDLYKLILLWTMMDKKSKKVLLDTAELFAKASDENTEMIELINSPMPYELIRKIDFNKLNNKID